ncbi:hypothetical protein [Burkholderia ubonensis]|uniref:hypothetical protein n=1 Tax=Burkholderia ubonensis TaxID=101571 RepID=UPI0012FB9D66|nr:hypothetical protein [Burkholderia ubonensis]
MIVSAAEKSGLLVCLVILYFNVKIRISYDVPFAMIALSIVATNAFAHELSHDPVDQESTQSIEVSARSGTGAPYPAASPQYRHPIEQQWQANHVAIDAKARDRAGVTGKEKDTASCVGPFGG